jgi:pimeloyl-ACP methyl ester carboxylesterase
MVKACPVVSVIIVLLSSFTMATIPSSSATSFRRGLVPTRLGLVHYTAVGGGERAGSTSSSAISKSEHLPAMLPIVAFHMSPRSVDEYKEIMNLSSSSAQTSSSASRLFVAMDEFGYGASSNPTESCSLDEIADCFLEVMRFLNIEKCIVAGSLMGCYMALSLASRYPDRIAGVVCSNLYYFQTEAREKALKAAAAADTNTADSTPIPDSWALEEDGSHISKIWGTRSSWLTPELNTRVTLDNLTYLVKRKERYAQGISIQDGGAFALAETCANIHCPILCLNGAAAVQFFDKIGMDMTGQFQQTLEFFPSTNKPEVAILEASAPGSASINMLNQNAPAWWEQVASFATKIEPSFKKRRKIED